MVHANSPQLCAAWSTPSFLSVVPLWTVAVYSNLDDMRNVSLNVPLYTAGSLLGLSDPRSPDPALTLHFLLLSSSLWCLWVFSSGKARTGTFRVQGGPPSTASPHLLARPSFAFPWERHRLQSRALLNSNPCPTTQAKFVTLSKVT